MNSYRQTKNTGGSRDTHETHHATMRYPTQFERDKINDPLYLVAFWRRPAREQHTMYRTMLNLFLQKGVPRFSQDKTLGLSPHPLRIFSPYLGHFRPCDLAPASLGFTAVSHGKM